MWKKEICVLVLVGLQVWCWERFGIENYLKAQMYLSVFKCSKCTCAGGVFGGFIGGATCFLFPYSIFALVSVGLVSVVAVKIKWVKFFFHIKKILKTWREQKKNVYKFNLWTHMCDSFCNMCMVCSWRDYNPFHLFVTLCYMEPQTSMCKYLWKVCNICNLLFRISQCRSTYIIVIEFSKSYHHCGTDWSCAIDNNDTIYFNGDSDVGNSVCYCRGIICFGHFFNYFFFSTWYYYFCVAIFVYKT